MLKTDKECKIIVNEINKASINNEVLISINIDNETYKKSYDFKLSFDEVGEFETIESTQNINTLNKVLKQLLNNNYFISFDINNY